MDKRLIHAHLFPGVAPSQGLSGVGDMLGMVARAWNAQATLRAFLPGEDEHFLCQFRCAAATKKQGHHQTSCFFFRSLSLILFLL